MAYDLTGQRFGRLLVLKKSDENIQKKSKLIMWHYICDCGNEVDIRSQDLRSGKTQSCGCLHKDIISKTIENNVKLTTKLTRKPFAR